MLASIIDPFYRCEAELQKGSQLIAKPRLKITWSRLPSPSVWILNHFAFC